MMTRLGAFCAGVLATVSVASAQLPFPQNWAGAPTGGAKQNVYPYPGQCVASTAAGSVGAALAAAGTPVCDTVKAPSFACEPSGSGLPNQSAGGYRSCGAIVAPTMPSLLATGPQPKFQWEVLNPPDYAPSADARFPGADYYEIAVHESWGFQALADVPATMAAGAFPPVPGGWTLPGRLFPNPKDAPAVAGTWTPNAAGVPNGMQWTGLVCAPVAPATTCSCPAEASAAYKTAYCTSGGRIPAGSPLLTPIWGIGQKKPAGSTITTLTDVLTAAGTFPVASFPAPAGAPDWSADDYVATWPSISIRGTTGKPVVVNWVNEFPNNHLFCPHPEAADWPCGIDRTFMGVKATIDPSASPFLTGVGTPTPGMKLPYNKVNQFGSPMQPDNSWVTHLHGGEIPPATDGFAEKWFGNARTGSLYAPQAWLLNPAFNAPEGALTDKAVSGPAGTQVGALFRPGGAPVAGGVSSWSNDTYAYPMVNGESTIWFHDHTLGKTHHNVIAGPAGFFPVKDPTKHGAVTNGLCQVPSSPSACEYTWLDPVTEPRNPLGQPKYDFFFALQDRDFNDDGTLNFPNGMSLLPAGATGPNGAGLAACVPNAAAGIVCAPPGSTEITPGPNPQVHPTWVPEYFAGSALVNGVLWPKKTVDAGIYRIRLVDGSDARCYTLGFSTVQAAGGTAAANAAKPKNDVSFTIVADEQGYLKGPVTAKSVTMCPGERYELLVDFTKYAGKQIFMTNSAAAPFPNGLNEPWRMGTLYPDMANIMRFDVSAAVGVRTCAAGSALTWPAPAGSLGCITVPTVLDADYVDLAAGARAWMRANTPAFPVAAEPAGAPAVPALPISAVRLLYLNEKVDGVTLASLGLQINGVPFEYDVTETPKVGTYEIWHVINTTVDAHPIHPHLIKAQILQRVPFTKAKYLNLLTGANTGTPSVAPGGGMVLTPDVLPAIAAGAVAALPDPSEGSWKDAMRAPPGQITTFVARWGGGWNGAEAPCTGTGMCFDAVTSGPYVWHCHINSHEDSEMMRTSLVVK
ncbi:MAG TPA: multicopper oxidase domain-containing protein [Anaeromyxobacter sp.]|nr:multicopper oxidase domain-containing protein [Anaeromyxobacter sp.]